MTKADKIRNSNNEDLSLIITTLIADALQSIGGVRFKDRNMFLGFVSDVSKDIKRWLEEDNDLGDRDTSGKIIELPCAIGDKLYGADMNKVVVQKVKSVLWKGYDAPEGQRFFMTIGDYSYVESDIGKTIFRTWKEAQDYLAKIKPKE